VLLPVRLLASMPLPEEELEEEVPPEELDEELLEEDEEELELLELLELDEEEEKLLTTGPTEHQAEVVKEFVGKSDN
jgi:hypothetical protein